MLKVNQVKEEGSIVYDAQKETWTPLISAFGALKIIKNKIELKKLWPPKVEGANYSKNKPPNVAKASSWNTKKIPYMFFCCYQSSKMIYKTLMVFL